ncbi:MAG: sulfatase-like hydrolase/transferase, partial [Paramuribaculum sp.]|nr:sulfatase-like hydrolase/transferase [Paramuribaculum sp.]
MKSNPAKSLALTVAALVALSAPVVASAASSAADDTATSSKRPNVILLVADDLGYGDMSCYGAHRVNTPRVDSIASQGVMFTNAHACASTSTPSRYSLLTGEYCFRKPNTNIADGDAALIIPADTYTVADMMHDAGYRTAAIGKWHLGLGSEGGKQDWNKPLDVTPADIGFDHHYIMAATADRVPCVFFEDGQVANYDPSAPIEVSYRKNFPGEPTGKDNPELLTKL